MFRLPKEDVGIPRDERTQHQQTDDQDRKLHDASRAAKTRARIQPTGLEANITQVPAKLTFGTG
jgi:hypothetical protein